MTKIKNLVRKQSGFTLIEILVVIGIIAILATIVLIAINPARQFAQARNSQRSSNVNAILNAIGQNIADNKGIFTCTGIGTNIDGTIRPVLTGAGTGVNLGCLAPTYIPSLPTDPKWISGVDTLYTVQDVSGRIQVCAPQAPLETAITPAVTICVTR